LALRLVGSRVSDQNPCTGGVPGRRRDRVGPGQAQAVPVLVEVEANAVM
jgi:hypothetical protein